MKARLLRVVYATVGAFVLSWPFVALSGDERRGFAAASGPAFVVAAVALVTGLLFWGLLEAKERWPARPPRPPRTGSASAARAWRRSPHRSRAG